MKKYLVILLLPLSAIFACNNEAKDSVEKADSLNEVKEERGDSTGKSIIHTDSESTDFLVDAFNGGMTEVQLGDLAQRKAVDGSVKSFGTMMVNDHTSANNQIKSLALERNVSLPASIGDENKKLVDDLSNKSGKEFDIAYINAMIDDHEKDIKEFEKASNNVKDLDVKNFVDNTLPVLRRHLDSAKAIKKVLK
jgi:putative membrane protein